MENLTWLEISKDALSHNIQQLRSLAGDDVLLCPCVKANAYGHGLCDAAEVFVKAGADWISVNSLYEAKSLREAGIDCPIYILGYVTLSDLNEAVELDCRLVVYNRETLDVLGNLKTQSKIHIKVETGNNRQGVLMHDLRDFALYADSFDNIEIEGLTTHFANIEDTRDHSYAESQIEKFNLVYDILKDAGIEPPIRHCANSAASILFKKTHYDMLRTGIANYGMWPSNETYVSFLKECDRDFTLKPALTWKAKIAQIKEIDAGEYVGYGCTYRTNSKTRLAIIPVGYYDGYDRIAGNSGAYVLINGKRAPIRGRVCMNIIMVDVTQIRDLKIEDEVVLLGACEDESISAELFASWAGSINYEITTRINDRIPRIYV